MTNALVGYREAIRGKEKKDKQPPWGHHLKQPAKILCYL